MNFYIINNNIFYKDYKILDGSLSFILLPIAILIIFHKKLVKYFSYIFLCIAIIGTIDSYYRFIIYKYFCFFTFIAFLHLTLLFPLINIKEYLIPNLSNLVFGIFGILIIFFLPYWPYALSRKQIMLLIPLIYLFTYILYKFKSKTDT